MVRADVGENAAVAGFLKKPIRAAGRGEVVRREVEDLEDAADGAFGDERAGVPGSFVTEAPE